MKIRIKPQELEIPEENPFENDLLDRKGPIDILSNIVASIKGPCVLAINAPWGTGKTTFLRMWSQHLRNENFSVVYFNAWETDFSGDPFIAISAELTNELEKYVSKSKIDAIKNVAEKIARLAPKAIMREVIAKIPVVNQIKEEELAQLFGSHIDDRLSEYQEGKTLIQDFKEVLEDSAKTLSDFENGKPLVLFIDELDRCRPSYAIELLEVAKHLFTVDNIVFVLAVNRSQLAHSIKVLYGREFDAEGYLRRFFDIDYTLPSPKRKAFIRETLKSVEIDKYFASAEVYGHKVLHLLENFWGIDTLSLRNVKQAIHRLGLALTSLPSNQRSLATITVTALLIIRTINSDLYEKFIRNDGITDQDIIQEIFSHPELGKLRYYTFAGQIFEAMIIAIFIEREEGKQEKSNLLENYKNLLKTQEAGTLHTSYEQIVRFVSIWTAPLEIEKINFNYCVACIELLHSDLRHE